LQHLGVDLEGGSQGGEEAEGFRDIPPGDDLAGGDGLGDVQAAHPEAMGRVGGLDHLHVGGEIAGAEGPLGGILAQVDGDLAGGVVEAEADDHGAGGEGLTDFGDGAQAVEEGVEEGVEFFGRAEVAHGFPPGEDGQGCIVGDVAIKYEEHGRRRDFA